MPLSSSPLPCSRSGAEEEAEAGAGAVRFQSTIAFDQHALDPCGAVLLGSLSTPNVTVTKLAP